MQQAISLAAREELGVGARDTSLRDPFPQESDAANVPWQVVTTAQPLNVVDIAIFRQQGNAWETLWDDEIRLPAENWYERFTEIVEKLSRKEFLDLLKQNGFQGSPAPEPRDSAPIPEEAADMLDRLTVPAQFGAVRLLHAEIRKNGESPELLGGLSRGYAMLGVLTERLWCTAHKVFKARALLYAERAMHRWPKSAEVVENRAYVRALIGLHRSALSDLSAAATLRKETAAIAKQSEGPDTPRAAAWAPAIEAFCRFDAAALEAAAEEESLTNFVRLLQMLVGECSNNDRETMKATERLLQAQPGSFRAIEGSIAVHQLGFHRVMLEFCLDLADRELLRQFRQTPELPANIVKQIDDFEKTRNSVLAQLFGGKAAPEMEMRLQVIEALRDAGAATSDDGEPSWNVLAQLLEEINFLHAWWQVNTNVQWLGLPPDETVEKVLPQVEHHPYADFLRSFRGDPEQAHAAAFRLAHSIDVATLEYHENLLLRLQYGDPDWYKAQWGDSFCNEDHVASGLFRVLQNAKYPKMSTLQLRQVSPYMPFGVASAITNDVGDARSKLSELEAQYAKSPVVLMALGNNYYGTRKWDDAMRCYRSAIQIDPSLESYWALAATYEQQGNEQLWLETLEEYLKTPNYGLDHARVQVRIANYYIKKRNWKKARTYADEAAQTWAAWAILKSAECAEAMQDWTTAEELYAAVGQRYENQAAEWYLFCKRTGQGRQQPALDLAMSFVRRAESDNPPYEVDKASVVRILNKQYKEAADDLDKSFRLWSNCGTGLQAALQYDEVGDTQSRDRIMARIKELRDTFYENTPITQAWLAMCDLIREHWANPESSKIEVAALEKIVQRAPPDQQTEVLYWAGQILERVGQGDEAVKYWKRCMGTGLTNLGGQLRTLAGAALWDHSITPAIYKDLILGPNNNGGPDQTANDQKSNP